KRALASSVEEARERLKVVYASALPDEEKRRRKAEEFAHLRAQFGKIVPSQPNNAFLVSISVYTKMVPAFERLLAQTDGSLPAFYERVTELAQADKQVRTLALATAPSTPDPSSAPPP